MNEALIVVALPLLLLGFIAAVVFSILRMGKKAEQHRLECWRQFSASRGLRFSPPMGGWLTPTVARIEGTVQGVPIVIDTYLVSSGKTSTAYTRVRATSVAPLPVNAKVYREHALSALGDLLGFQDVAVGDEAFDRACVVKADDEAAVRSLLHKPLRDALLRWLQPALQGGSLAYKRGEVTLVWGGVERSHEVLDAALSAALHASASRGVALQIFG